MKNPDCIFCKIIYGEIQSIKIWEDKNFYAFLDAIPVTPGHVLIIPKNHVDYFFDMKNSEYKGIFEVAKKLQKSLKKATNAKRIGLEVNGFGVPHAHLHLIPMQNFNDMDSCNGKKGIPEEMKLIAEKIKTEIKKDSKK